MDTLRTVTLTLETDCRFDVDFGLADEASLGRNEQGRLRVLGIAVDLRLGVPASGLPLLERAVAPYEDFCTVTQSVRVGIPVTARVLDGGGVLPSR